MIKYLLSLPEAPGIVSCSNEYYIQNQLVQEKQYDLNMELLPRFHYLKGLLRAVSAEKWIWIFNNITDSSEMESASFAHGSQLYQLYLENAFIPAWLAVQKGFSLRITNKEGQILLNHDKVQNKAEFFCLSLLHSSDLAVRDKDGRNAMDRISSNVLSSAARYYFPDAFSPPDFAVSMESGTVVLHEQANEGSKETGKLEPGEKFVSIDAKKAASAGSLYIQRIANVGAG